MHLIIGAETTSRVLHELLKKFTPALEELGELLRTEDQANEPSTRSLAKSLLAFQREDYEEAALLALPRIESLARTRLAAAGDLQFEVQRGQTRGQYPQLAKMLGKLKPHLDTSWHRFLCTFLVSPFGRELSQ